MKKSILLALSALVLAACGGGNGNQNQGAQSPESNSNAQESSSEGSGIKNADGQITLSGNIDNNVTWKDLGLPVDYIVEGYLYLDGNSLVTVEPGVTIMFTGVDGCIQVGENAGIKMQGTKDKPIVLTGPTNNQNPGAWECVRILSNRNDNILENVEFKNAGSRDWILEIEGKASVKNCTFDGASANGITIGQSAQLAAFENNTIKNCKEYPVVFHNGKALKNFGTGNVIENNGKQQILCNFYWLDEDNAEYQIHKAPVPYLFKDGMGLNNRSTTTIDPGVKILIGRNTIIDIDGAVIAKFKGTAAEPITIEGEEDKPGFWEAFNINTKEEESVFEYVNISNLGNKDADRALYVGREFAGTMKNVSLSKTKAQNGIMFDYLDKTAKTRLENITVDDSPSNFKFIVNTTEKDEMEQTASSLNDILKKL
ncbi:MAG: right-handed parallel beta-helix repeat-containing protein [Bacteroidales bacterium]|nr:right-handed parallel beta-helix repeat-containing protein [Bacteroidales bacterium]